MFKNFLVVTWRNLRRNSLYSTINISGLAIGICCSVLILLWVSDEKSFDDMVAKKDRLYQVWVNAHYDNKVSSWISVPLPTYEAMKSAHSSIVNSCVAGWGGDRLVTYQEKRFIKKGYFVSKEFLTMFQYPLLLGSAEQVMENPSSIVITERLAQLLFGAENPIGKLVRVDDKSTLEITGVLSNIPENSSFQFDYIIPWKHRESIEEWVVDNKSNWGNYSFQVFVELNDQQNAIAAETSIRNMLMENGEDDIHREFFLYPMSRWRLYSNFENGEEVGGLSDYVQLFSIIAAFILIMACINFMNLATARSEKRVREVGIRKSLGSSKGQLIAQFIGESLLISLIAYLAAIMLTILLLKPYNQLVDKNLFLDFQSFQFWFFSIGIVLFTGLISGSYPALYLSSFKPAKTLKGSVFSGKKMSTPRRVLVSLQFVFSIILMFSTLVIFKQLELVKNRELGYNQENLITIENTDAIAEHYEVLKNDLLQIGRVEAVTRSNSPINDIHSNNFLGWPGKPDNERVMFTTISAEYDYTKTMGIELLLGRDFSKEFASDSNAIIINKAALDVMNLENPIGTNLDLWGGKRRLIGVVDNVLMGNPNEKVKPMFMILNANWIRYVTLRLSKTDDLNAALQSVEAVFNKHNPAYPFSYEFVDVAFGEKFEIINLTQRLATIFSVLALFITGLGVFGLASYTAEQRIKEIGIRKVLGASVFSLISLISKESAKLVVVAFLVATPIAWYLLDMYLDRYTIRVNIMWWMPVLVGLAALIFSIGIVSNQARRAALANPSKSLRSE